MLCCVQILIALEVLEVRFVEVFVDRHAFEILIKKVAFARWIVATLPCILGILGSIEDIASFDLVRIEFGIQSWPHDVLLVELWLVDDLIDLVLHRSDLVFPSL